MTLENYRIAKSRGVTGPETPTCFPAALDSISSIQSASDEVYYKYWGAYVDQAENGVNNKRSREHYRYVLSEFGVTSLKGFIGKRAKNKSDTKRILENAKKGGWRVIIRTEDEHAVGLRNTSDGWRMVGTWTPAKAEDRFTSEEIFHFLFQDKKKVGGKPVANMVLVAPEKKKKG